MTWEEWNNVDYVTITYQIYWKEKKTNSLWI